MYEFLPSEIARLVLGYLEETKCHDSYNVFLRESPHLEECRLLVEKGVKFRRTIEHKTLLTILRDYSRLTTAQSNAQYEAQGNSESIGNAVQAARRASDPVFKTPVKNSEHVRRYTYNQRFQMRSRISPRNVEQDVVDCVLSPLPNSNKILVIPKVKNRSAVQTKLNFQASDSALGEVHSTEKQGQRAASAFTYNSVSCSPVRCSDMRHTLFRGSASANSVFNKMISTPRKELQTESIVSSLSDCQNLVFQNDNVSDTENIDSSTEKGYNEECDVHRCEISHSSPSQKSLARDSSSSLIEYNTATRVEHPGTLTTSKEISQRYTPRCPREIPISSLSVSNGGQTKCNSAQMQTKDAHSVITVDSSPKVAAVTSASKISSIVGNKNCITISTMEFSATPEYTSEPPTYTRAPDTDSPRLVLSHQRAFQAPFITPVKDVYQLRYEEWRSPKRKSIIPRRRLISEASPLVKQHASNEVSLPNEDIDHLVALEELLNNPSFAEKIAENINLVKNSEKRTDDVEKDSGSKKSSGADVASEDIRFPEAMIKDIMGRTESDPAFEQYMNYLAERCEASREFPFHSNSISNDFLLSPIHLSSNSQQEAVSNDKEDANNDQNAGDSVNGKSPEVIEIDIDDPTPVDPAHGTVVETPSSVPQNSSSAAFKSPSPKVANKSTDGTINSRNVAVSDVASSAEVIVHADTTPGKSLQCSSNNPVSSEKSFSNSVSISQEDSKSVPVSRSTRSKGNLGSSKKDVQNPQQPFQIKTRSASKTKMKRSKKTEMRKSLFEMTPPRPQSSSDILNQAVMETINSDPVEETKSVSLNPQNLTASASQISNVLPENTNSNTAYVYLISNPSAPNSSPAFFVLPNPILPPGNSLPSTMPMTPAPLPGQIIQSANSNRMLNASTPLQTNTFLNQTENKVVHTASSTNNNCPVIDITSSSPENIAPVIQVPPRISNVLPSISTLNNDLQNSDDICSEMSDIPVIRIPSPVPSSCNPLASSSSVLVTPSKCSLTQSRLQEEENNAHIIESNKTVSRSSTSMSNSDVQHAIQVNASPTQTIPKTIISKALNTPVVHMEQSPIKSVSQKSPAYVFQTLSPSQLREIEGFSTGCSRKLRELRPKVPGTEIPVLEKQFDKKTEGKKRKAEEEPKRRGRPPKWQKSDLSSQLCEVKEQEDSEESFVGGKRLSSVSTSPHKDDPRSAREIFSEILGCSLTPIRTPSLTSLFTNARKLRGNKNRISESHVRSLDFGVNSEQLKTAKTSPKVSKNSLSYKRDVHKKISSPSSKNVQKKKPVPVKESRLKGNRLIKTPTTSDSTDIVSNVSEGDINTNVSESSFTVEASPRFKNSALSSTGMSSDKACNLKSPRKPIVTPKKSNAINGLSVSSLVSDHCYVPEIRSAASALLLSPESPIGRNVSIRKLSSEIDTSDSEENEIFNASIESQQVGNKSLSSVSSNVEDDNDLCLNKTREKSKMSDRSNSGLTAEGLDNEGISKSLQVLHPDVGDSHSNVKECSKTDSVSLQNKPHSRKVCFSKIKKCKVRESAKLPLGVKIPHTWRQSDIKSYSGGIVKKGNKKKKIEHYKSRLTNSVGPVSAVNSVYVIASNAYNKRRHFNRIKNSEDIDDTAPVVTQCMTMTSHTATVIESKSISSTTDGETKGKEATADCLKKQTTKDNEKNLSTSLLDQGPLLNETEQKSEPTLVKVGNLKTVSDQSNVGSKVSENKLADLCDSKISSINQEKKLMNKKVVQSKSNESEESENELEQITAFLNQHQKKPSEPCDASVNPEKENTRSSYDENSVPLTPGKTLVGPSFSVSPSNKGDGKSQNVEKQDSVTNRMSEVLKNAESSDKSLAQMSLLNIDVPKTSPSKVLVNNAVGAAAEVQVSAIFDDESSSVVLTPGKSLMKLQSPKIAKAGDNILKSMSVDFLLDLVHAED